ncbi:hypothetical protein B0H19DRAFT_421599 [Mycena capillaripes]|nr:hypothetical protein B0H19DRAFT_421599 [Mycena capillaripes]
MAKLPQDAALGVLLEEADTSTCFLHGEKMELIVMISAESLPANPDGDTSNAREFTNLGRIHPSGQRNIRRLRLAIPAVPRGRPPNPQQRQQEPPSNRPSKEEPVKQGPVSLAEDGSFASGIWKTNWLVLTDKSLSLSRQESVIPLCDLVTITRVPRKPYCVVLKTQDQRQRYLAFINEVEMHGWWDAIASRVPGIERPPLTRLRVPAAPGQRPRLRRLRAPGPTEHPAYSPRPSRHGSRGWKAPSAGHRDKPYSVH